ncbi:LysR family transcriptional regulator [Candidatus Albibeggiatoa sp. nov. NOAA]|uniref:LysR family transcriptional regulator n=1 Tax=Candidatus Albibeggiatoa sp. nov. NOAA TaxID=3162724 RepID=UPI0032F4C35D|nr:LysR family transcriptional regulator [Thiotrichaceae bacterium]
MDANLLKVFVAVADTRSISLAAKQLKFAQSNVTARIKQLEKNLGHDLFHRVPKGVILTQAGERFYSHATDIVHKMELAMLEMKNITHQGHLRVGSTESNAVTRIVPFLVKLHNDYPQMQLELFTGTTDIVTQMILNFKVDIAFITGKPSHQDLTVLNQFEEQIVILEPQTGVVPNVILSFKKGCAYNAFLQNYFRQLGKYDYKTLEFGSLETILGCVKVGMGMTALPLNIVKKLGYADQLKITELDKSIANLPTCMVCRKDAVPIIEGYLRNLTFPPHLLVS